MYFQNLPPTIHPHPKIFPNSPPILPMPQLSQFHSFQKSHQKQKSCESISTLLHKPTNTKWRSRCSMKGVYCLEVREGRFQICRWECFEEVREVLGLRLYGVFGVGVVEGVLGRLGLTKGCQEEHKHIFDGDLSAELREMLDFKNPRIHILTHIPENIHQFPPNFLTPSPTTIPNPFPQNSPIPPPQSTTTIANPMHNYHTNRQYNNDEVYRLVQSGYRLCGFGDLLAVGNLLQDFRCVGGCGKNIGYCLDTERRQARVIKIAAQQCLSYSCPIPQSPPNTTNCSLNISLSFHELTKHDQQQYLETIKKILLIKDEEIWKIFEDFVKIDIRFKTIFQQFMERKGKILRYWGREVQVGGVRGILGVVWGGKAGKELEGKEYGELVNMRKLLAEYLLLQHPDISEIPNINKCPIKRQRDLQKLTTILQTHKFAILHGPKSHCKSHLILQYLHSINPNLSSPPKTIWFNLQNSHLLSHPQSHILSCQLKSYMHKNYQYSKQIETIEELIDYFYGKISDFLMVFDGVTDIGALGMFLDKKERPAIVVVVDGEDWGGGGMEMGMEGEGWGKLGEMIVEVGKFQEGEVVDGWRESVGKGLDTEEEKCEEYCVRELYKIVDGSPMALLEILEYLSTNPRVKLQQLLPQIKCNKQNIFKLIPHTESTITFQLLSLSITHSLPQVPQLPPDPQIPPLLTILAYLSPKLSHLKFLQKMDNNNLLQKLIRFSMVLVVTEEGTSIGKLDQLWRYAVMDVSRRDWDIWGHGLREVVGKLEDGVEVGVYWEQIVNVCCNIGNQYLEAGNAKKALYFFEKALQVLYKSPQAQQETSSQSKSYHKKLSKILTSLGSIYGNLGLYEKQINTLKHALKLKQKYYGSDHEQTATTHTNLGAAYLSISSYQNSKHHLQLSLKTKTESQSYPTPQQIPLLLNLSILESISTNYTSQQKLLQQVLQIALPYYGNRDIRVSSIFVNLALCYGHQGNRDKERVYLEKAMRICEGLEDRSGTGTGSGESQNGGDRGILYNNLGIAIGRSGRYLEQSKEYFLLASEVKRKHYGDEHPEVAIPISNLGFRYLASKNYQNSIQYLLSSYKTLKTHLTPSPTTSTSPTPIYTHYHPHLTQIQTHLSTLSTLLQKPPKCFQPFQKLSPQLQHQLTTIFTYPQIIWNTQEDQKLYEVLVGKNMGGKLYGMFMGEFRGFLSGQTQERRHQLRRVVGDTSRYSVEEYWNTELDDQARKNYIRIYSQTKNNPSTPTSTKSNP